jgi:hypothetical protein
MEHVRLAVKDGAPVHVEPALVIGVWAVTPALDMECVIVPGMWRVTHVPTGLCIPTPNVSEHEATRLAAALAERDPNLLRDACFGDDISTNATAKETCQDIRDAWLRWL